MLGFFHFIKSNLRWLVGGLLLTLFSSFGQTFFIAQFNKPIRETFGLTDGQYGMLYMVATLASAAIVFASALGPGLTGLAIDDNVESEWQLIAMGLYSVLVSFLMLVATCNLARR